jgi:hypothetical protein
VKDFIADAEEDIKVGKDAPRVAAMSNEIGQPAVGVQRSPFRRRSQDIGKLMGPDIGNTVTNLYLFNSALTAPPNAKR